jgi:hypothetical protein
MASRRIALLAVAAGLVAALGAVASRRATRAQGQSEPETYTCRCGTAYRVSGTGRHRVYWLQEAAESDPVLGTACVKCEAPLPAGHALATH